MSKTKTSPDQSKERSLDDLIFGGFNRRVVALDRYTGELVWEWRAPEGSGYVALLIDGDRLIASVNGYMYCLDPLFGQEVWHNPLSGLGVGVPSLASARGTSTQGGPAAAIAARNAAAGGSAATVG
jgi:outer membrane protein assembly factor BamB